MIDIVGVGNGPGGDIRTFDAQTSKGANILSVQIGALEYAPEFGIDLRFFIQEDFQFQNESFRAYLIQRLSEQNVTVNEVVQLVDDLFQNLTFVVGDTGRDTGGLIA